MSIITFTLGKEKVNSDVESGDSGDSGGEVELASFPSYSETNHTIINGRIENIKTKSSRSKHVFL